VSDKVIVPVAGLGCLALDAAAFREALAAGANLFPVPPGAPLADERLLSAEEIARELNVPTTWIEQSARTGRIPSLAVGRYVRFRRSAVEAALVAQTDNH
jgi:excisionase family DNA binding protein